MQVHFPKYLRLLESLVLLWIFLLFAKFFGFDFNLDLSLIFYSLANFAFIFLVLETIKNRQEVCALALILSVKLKDFYYLKNKNLEEILENNIKKFFPGGYSGKISRFMAGVLTPLFVLIFIFKKILITKDSLLVLFTFGFLFNVFSQSLPLDFEILFIFLIALWLLLVLIFKIESRISIVIAIVLFLVCPYVIIRFNDYELTEKISIWVFVFLSIGIFQNFLSFFRKSGRI